MYINNVKELKKNLRMQVRRSRERIMPEFKSRMDSNISKKLFDMKEYADADMIFTYVSKEIEVDTTALIKALLHESKHVAVPLCIPKSCEMEFYEIESLDQLEKGNYSLLEPVPSLCRRAFPTESSVCIVPGLCFDFQGYRLGYGKGYYDRFLAGFKGKTIGLCYSACVQKELPHGHFDKPVNILITERYVRRIAD